MGVRGAKQAASRALGGLQALAAILGCVEKVCADTHSQLALRHVFAVGSFLGFPGCCGRRLALLSRTC